MPMNDVFKISITFNILIVACQNVSLLASANYQYWHIAFYEMVNLLQLAEFCFLKD